MAASPEPVVDEKDLYLAFRLMKERDLDGARERLDAGLEKARAAGNLQAQGLYLSALGVLSKLKKDYKEAYKFYQQAEKLLPDDDSVKIITATLLIEEFNQHDTAARKLKKILDAKPADPALVHHALALLACAHLVGGKKDEARECLAKLLAQDFSLLRSATNVNYRLPELLIRRNFETGLGLDYLRKALDLAQKRKEPVYVGAITRLIRQIDAMTAAP